MKAIEAFPISEEEARDLDELKTTFPDKSELRAVLEDYFHIYDDNASMEPQKFDMYFADFINDERVEDSIPFKEWYEENERLNPYHTPGGPMGSITNNRKSIKSAKEFETETDIEDYLNEEYDNNPDEWDFGEELYYGVGDKTPYDTVEQFSSKEEAVKYAKQSHLHYVVKYSEFGDEIVWTDDPKMKNVIKSAFKKGDGFENAYGATIVIDDPDANGRIQYVVRSGDSADCKSVDSEETMQKILDQNGYIKSSKETIKSALDPTEAQVFKETLIRAGYTEEQAQQILDQANQVEETQGEMMTSGCHGKQKKEHKKGTENKSISSAKNVSIKSIKRNDFDF